MTCKKEIEKTSISVKNNWLYFFQKEHFIYPNILPVGSAIMNGVSKLGKSFLALSWAKEIVESGKSVSVFSFEDNKIRAKDRLKALGLTDYDYDQLCFMTKADIPDVKGYDFILMLERYIKVMKHDLYVIDPIVSIQLENIHPNNYKKLYAFYSRFSELAHKHNCCILFITDYAINKNNKILGAKALSDATDTIIHAKKHKGKGIMLETSKRSLRI